MGAHDNEALVLIKLLFPHSKTTLTTINHYRAKMKADFEDVETNSAAPGLDLARLRNLVLCGEAENADRVGAEPNLSSPKEVIRQALRGWKTNAEALELARSAFPLADVKNRAAGDERTALRHRGERIPTDNEVRRRQAGAPWTPDLKPE